jgi:hypothetical protein
MDRRTVLLGAVSLLASPRAVEPNTDNRTNFVQTSPQFAGLDAAAAVPLAVVVIVVFGKPQLIGTPQRWETALLLIFITMVDLFGGYTFNIALSRRTMDVTPGGPM